MPFWGSVYPDGNEKYKKQQELTKITDEEYKDMFKVPPLKWYAIIHQIICFVVFLGPIRLLVGLVMFFICGTLIQIIRYCVRLFGLEFDTGKRFCIRIANVAFRFLLFASGIIYIKTNGQFDEEARFVISNHVSVFDSFILLLIHPMTPAIKSEVQKVNYLKYILENVDPVFVSRDQAHGHSQELLDRANDKRRFPVLTFPEGTISGSQNLLRFRKGAFLSDYKVQPITYKFLMPLVPKGWNTFVWHRFSLWRHIWNLISMPFCVIVVDFLKPIRKSVEGKGDVEQFAIAAQLQMANFLGLKAVDRTSHDLFVKKPQPEAGKEKVQ